MTGITIFNRQIHLQTVFAELPVVIGGHAGQDPAGTDWSVPAEDFAPQQCRILESSNDDSIILANLGGPVQLADGKRLLAGQRQEVLLPATVWVGETIVRLFRIKPDDSDSANFVVLNHSRPGESCELTPNDRRAPGIPTLSAWFDCLTGLQRSSTAENDFFRQAARALFDPGGLDAGMVLLRDKDTWRVAASYIPHPEREIAFRPDLLEQVVKTKQTRFHTGHGAESVAGDATYLAIAPVVDEHQEVVGAIYGMRSRNAQNHRRGIRHVEAHFVRLIAETVAATIRRSRREAEFAENRTLLRQVFPESVVERLHTDPLILEGQDKVVTTMFADIRGFSSIANRLSARLTWQLITDVMDCWTDIVIRNSGAIVDYYGDGLAAFWNAPLDMENHASLAVICGYQLRQSLPELSCRWSPIIGQPLEIGTGIATGTVQVGNCGSRRRIKYGPHGRSVNLARRLESLTAGTGIRLLVSGETANQICNDFMVRRLFQASLAGFAEPIDVWQPLDDDFPDPLHGMAEYESALQEFESRKFRLAVDRLESYLQIQPTDAAARYLLSLARSEQGPLVELNRSAAIRPSGIEEDQM